MKRNVRLMANVTVQAISYFVATTAGQFMLAQNVPATGTQIGMITVYFVLPALLAGLFLGLWPVHRFPFKVPSDQPGRPGSP